MEEKQTEGTTEAAEAEKTEGVSQDTDSAILKAAGIEAPEAETVEKESPADESADKSQEETKDAKDKAAVSEDYSLTVPEGSIVTDEHAKSVEAFAKELKLPKDAAEALLKRDTEVFVEVVKAAKTDAVRELQEAHRNEVKRWPEMIAADKDLGGERLKETQALSERWIKENGSPVLAELLDKTGYRHHPELVRALAKAQRKMEPKQEVTGSQSPQKLRDSEVFYSSNTQ